MAARSRPAPNNPEGETVKRTTMRMTAAVLGLALAAAACGDDDGDDSAAADDVTTTAPDTAAAAEDDGASIPETTGPADESLDPVVIGMINMDEGTPSYPLVSSGADAAAEFINAELSGINGRPVEVRHCNVGVDQASNQACAQEFANADDVNVVMNGYAFSSSFGLPVLEAAGVPVLLQTPLTPADFQAPNGFAYQGGNAGGGAGTATYAARFLEAEEIVIFGADDDALRAAVDQIEQLPATEGVDISVHHISNTAADVTADIQASGAADADAILALVNAPQCLQVAQTVRDLGIDTPIVSTTVCAVPATLDENPEVFEGWNIVGSGLPPLLAEGASKELDFFREVYPNYGSEDERESFHALGGFGAMLALWDIGNDLPDTLTREDWTEGMRSFTGPYFGGVSEVSCPGRYYPAVCANDVRAFTLDDQGVMTQVQSWFDPLG